jgi:hypothetical protein
METEDAKMTAETTILSLRARLVVAAHGWLSIGDQGDHTLMSANRIIASVDQEPTTKAIHKLIINLDT